MRSEIPFPKNPGIAKSLKSAPMRLALLKIALKAAQDYRAMAPKRKGTLAASAFAGTQLSDLGRGLATPGDRYMGVVRVYAPYSVWNEMGAGPGKHPRSTGNMPKYGPFKGSHTFTKVLEAQKARNT